MQLVLTPAQAWHLLQQALDRGAEGLVLRQDIAACWADLASQASAHLLMRPEDGGRVVCMVGHGLQPCG